MTDPPPRPNVKPDETKMQLIEYGREYKGTVALICAADAIENQLEDTIADMVRSMTSPEHDRMSGDEIRNWFIECLTYRPEILKLPDNKVQPLFRVRVAQLHDYLKNVAGIGYLERRKSSIDVLGRYRGAAEYGKTMAVSEEDWILASNRKGAYPIGFKTSKEKRP